MKSGGFQCFFVSPLLMRVSGVKKRCLRVQNLFFPNLELSQVVFFTYILTLFLDTRITRPGRGVRQIVLLPVLVFGGSLVRRTQTLKNEEPVWDC